MWRGSDQEEPLGSLKSAAVAKVQKGLGAHRHFAAPCPPWASGAAEAVDREALNVLRALLSELLAQESESTGQQPMTQPLLSHALAARLGGKAPTELLCGQERSTPFLPLRHSTSGEAKPLPEARVSRLREAQRFSAALAPCFDFCDRS